MKNKDLSHNEQAIVASAVAIRSFMADEWVMFSEHDVSTKVHFLSIVARGD